MCSVQTVHAEATWALSLPSCGKPSAQLTQGGASLSDLLRGGASLNFLKLCTLGTSLASWNPLLRGQE